MLVMGPKNAYGKRMDAMHQGFPSAKKQRHYSPMTMSLSNILDSSEHRRQSLALPSRSSGNYQKRDDASPIGSFSQVYRKDLGQDANDDDGNGLLMIFNAMELVEVTDRTQTKKIAEREVSHGSRAEQLATQDVTPEIARATGCDGDDLISRVLTDRTGGATFQKGSILQEGAVWQSSTPRHEARVVHRGDIKLRTPAAGSYNGLDLTRTVARIDDETDKLDTIQKKFIVAEELKVGHRIIHKAPQIIVRTIPSNSIVQQDPQFIITSSPSSIKTPQVSEFIITTSSSNCNIRQTPGMRCAVSSESAYEELKRQPPGSHYRSHIASCRPVDGYHSGVWRASHPMSADYNNFECKRDWKNYPFARHRDPVGMEQASHSLVSADAFTEKEIKLDWTRDDEKTLMKEANIKERDAYRSMVESLDPLSATTSKSAKPAAVDNYNNVWLSTRMEQVAPAWKELQNKCSTHDSVLEALLPTIQLETLKLSELKKTRENWPSMDSKGKDKLIPVQFVPLTKEEEEEVEQALHGPNRNIILVTHQASNIDITRAVMQCLKPGAWLNDEVINLYLELLKEREFREPKSFLKCHFFNTFFFNKLYKDAHSYDFKAVKRWTTQRRLGYSILDCDKIFVPIHKEIHWCLAVIDLRKKKLLYLDSLKGRDGKVLQILSKYIKDEAKDKLNKNLDASAWDQECPEDIPEQLNGCDCGMFMIKYADFYSRGDELNFDQANMEYFRRRTVLELLQLKAR